MVENRRAVVDHGRGHFTTKLDVPQTCLAIAALDVGIEISVFVSADQRLGILDGIESLAVPAARGQLFVQTMTGGEVVTLPLAEDFFGGDGFQRGPHFVEFCW